MLELIRTFWSWLTGPDVMIVEEGQLWRCTKCNMVFVTREAAKSHDCKET